MSAGILVSSQVGRFASLLPYLGMAGVAVELHGLADEWERDTTIRARLRDSGVLFVEESEGTRLATNIRGAERHAEVLLPLLPRLRRGDDIGMCTIPQLEVETLRIVLQPPCVQESFPSQGWLLLLPLLLLFFRPSECWICVAYGICPHLPCWLIRYAFTF